MNNFVAKEGRDKTFPKTMSVTREAQVNVMEDDTTDHDWEILDCIDDGLNAFGEQVKFTIYWKLLIISNVDRRGILENTDILLKTLKETFGFGALVIEKEIISRITAHFNLKNSESAVLGVVIKSIRSGRLLDNTELSNNL